MFSLLFNWDVTLLVSQEVFGAQSWRMVYDKEIAAKGSESY